MAPLAGTGRLALLSVVPEARVRARFPPQRYACGTTTALQRIAARRHPTLQEAAPAHEMAGGRCSG